MFVHYYFTSEYSFNTLQKLHKFISILTCDEGNFDNLSVLFIFSWRQYSMSPLTGYSLLISLFNSPFTLILGLRLTILVLDISFHAFTCIFPTVFLAFADYPVTKPTLRISGFCYEINPISGYQFFYQLAFI